MNSDRYLDPYRDSYLKHGSKFEVTLWASPHSQRKRFAVFTELYDFSGKTLLDAGCALGDFAGFLTERAVPYRQYVGVDGLPEVIDSAKARGLPRTQFVSGDFLLNPKLLATGNPDAIVISGALNTMSDTQALEILQSCWRATGDVLLFNFLSDTCGEGAPPQDGIARRLDTLALLRWAMRATPYVRFRQDYFREGHDATIFMSRSDTSVRYLGKV